MSPIFLALQLSEVIPPFLFHDTWSLDCFWYYRLQNTLSKTPHFYPSIRYSPSTGSAPVYQTAPLFTLMMFNLNPPLFFVSVLKVYYLVLLVSPHSISASWNAIPTSWSPSFLCRWQTNLYQPLLLFFQWDFTYHNRCISRHHASLQSLKNQSRQNQSSCWFSLCSCSLQSPCSYPKLGGSITSSECLKNFSYFHNFEEHIGSVTHQCVLFATLVIFPLSLRPASIQLSMLLFFSPCFLKLLFADFPTSTFQLVQNYAARVLINIHITYSYNSTLRDFRWFSIKFFLF